MTEDKIPLERIEAEARELAALKATAAVRDALADAQSDYGIEAEEFIRLLREHYGYEVRLIDGSGAGGSMDA